MKFLEDMDCAFPKNLQEALKLMADEKSRGRPIAGGTDLMVQWSSGVLPMPERAIDLSGLPELKGISETTDSVVIGAAVTHAEIRRSPIVQAHLPSLAQAAATIGGAQIQARGTIAPDVRRVRLYDVRVFQWQAEVTARFEAGRISGFSGCNRFMGGYTVDRDKLVIGNLAGTMMSAPYGFPPTCSSIQDSSWSSCSGV